MKTLVQFTEMKFDFSSVNYSKIEHNSNGHTYYFEIDGLEYCVIFSKWLEKNSVEWAFYVKIGDEWSTELTSKNTYKIYKYVFYPFLFDKKLSKYKILRYAYPDSAKRGKIYDSMWKELLGDRITKILHRGNEQKNYATLIYLT